MRGTQTVTPTSTSTKVGVAVAIVMMAAALATVGPKMVGSFAAGVTTSGTTATSTSAFGCTDTDGGKAFDVKGTVKVGSFSITDSCKNTKTLNEAWCDPVRKYANNVEQNCALGCKDGSCITEPVFSLITPVVATSSMSSVPYTWGTINADFKVVIKTFDQGIILGGSQSNNPVVGYSTSTKNNNVRLFFNDTLTGVSSTTNPQVRFLCNGSSAGCTLNPNTTTTVTFTPYIDTFSSTQGIRAGAYSFGIDFLRWSFSYAPSVFKTTSTTNWRSNYMYVNAPVSSNAPCSGNTYCVDLVYPIGGENITSSTLPIRWNKPYGTSSYINIGYSNFDGHLEWIVTGLQSTASIDQSYNWVIPPHLKGKSLKIKISNGSAQDTSQLLNIR